MSARVPAELPPGVPALLTPREVGRINRIDPKTVTRWADRGRVEFIRTASGNRLYPSAQFADLLKITGWPV